jgi:hypothetical protein
MWWSVLRVFTEKLGTQLTSLTYSFVLLVIALEMAGVETPSCRATSAKGIHNPVPIDTLSAA